MPTSERFWGTVALVLVYSAYVAEVYRAGIDSVHPSQEAAARSLGLSRWQSLRHVILPQAVRRVIPPLLNDFIGLQKDTALLSVIGVVEAFRQAELGSVGRLQLHPLVVAAVLFLAITIPLARFTDWLIARDRRAAAGRQGRRHERRSPRCVCEGVHKSFGKLEVLRGIDLDVAEHEVVCLIGASGSGKSTLLRCVNLLEPIDAGRDLRGRPGHHRPRRRREPGAPRHRHRVPVVQPVPAHDRAAERDAGAAEGARHWRRPRPRRRRASCWTGSGWPTSATTTPTGCPAASSSGWRSSGRWPCGRG